MPSVMTIEGTSGRPKRCKYLIARGQYGRRKFHGCYRTKADATAAAKRKGKSWMVVHSRPPGVPFGSARKPALPRYGKRERWIGGSKNTLYVFTDPRTGRGEVMPVSAAQHVGRIAEVRPATRAEAEGKVRGIEGWQKKLHSGWRTLGSAAGPHRNRARKSINHTRDAIQSAKIAMAQFKGEQKMVKCRYVLDSIVDGVAQAQRAVVEATHAGDSSESKTLLRTAKALEAKADGLYTKISRACVTGNRNMQRPNPYRPRSR